MNLKYDPDSAYIPSRLHNVCTLKYYYLKVSM
jgi:hypothetical protein